jgi:hypothetical protein
VSGRIGNPTALMEANRCSPVLMVRRSLHRLGHVCSTSHVQTWFMAMQQNSDAIEEFGEMMDSYPDVVDGHRDVYTVEGKVTTDAC